jgi:hypothetical protein
MDHMALVYLINKPQVFSRLAKWLLLFSEYDFKIVYKLGRSHIMANALSRLPNHTKLVGIPNQISDAHMFTLQLEWLQNVYEYLLKCPKDLPSHMQYLAQRTKPFMFQKGVLYIFGQDNRFP